MVERNALGSADWTTAFMEQFAISIIMALFR